jgi:hypothetical protein
LVALARRVSKAAARLDCHHGSSAGNLQPFNELVASSHHGSSTDLTMLKVAKASVICLRPGCKGTCPLHVVIRSNKPDGVPATCFQCERVFKAPSGFSTDDKGARKGSGKGGGGQGEGSKNNKKLQDELKALKAEIKLLNSQGLPPNLETAVVEDEADELTKEIAGLQEVYAACKKHDPESEFTKEFASKLEEARARKAASKPLQAQVPAVEFKLAKKRRAKAAAMPVLD